MFIKERDVSWEEALHPQQLFVEGCEKAADRQTLLRIQMHADTHHETFDLKLC